jgi:glycerophosphoryl diester phosphodiesterase
MIMTLTVGAIAGLLAANDVEWIAHRGESADAPENTLSAFKLAWDRDVEAIELDVHLSKDDVLVVSHDASTRRTTGIPKMIKESTFEELKSLDAGKWKDARFAGETMPTLEQALATIPDKARCFIEVKVGPEAVPALVKAVRSSGKKPEQLVVISFNADTVAESKKQLPELKAFFLAGFRKDRKTGEWGPKVEDLIAQAKSIGADGLDLAYQGPVGPELVEQVKDAGLGIYVWTVDDLAEARRLIEAGVDGITSNKPAWLKEQIKKQ